MLSSLLLKIVIKLVLPRGLLEAKKLLNLAHIHTSHKAEVREVTLLFLSLLGQDVTLEGVFTLDLT